MNNLNYKKISAMAIGLSLLVSTGIGQAYASEVIGTLSTSGLSGGGSSQATGPLAGDVGGGSAGGTISGTVGSAGGTISGTVTGGTDTGTGSGSTGTTGSAATVSSGAGGSTSSSGSYVGLSSFGGGSGPSGSSAIPPAPIAYYGTGGGYYPALDQYLNTYSTQSSGGSGGSTGSPGDVATSFAPGAPQAGGLGDANLMVAAAADSPMTASAIWLVIGLVLLGLLVLLALGSDRLATYVRRRSG